jgi:hypothetical protein
MANQGKLKAFVRVDGTGKVVTGGPILQAKKPTVGNWREINRNECCNTTLPTNCIEFVVDTTEGTEFTFNFNTTGPINFTIDWGDGTTHPDSGAGGFYEEIHTYPLEDRQYTARICFDSPESVLELNFVGNN